MAIFFHDDVRELLRGKRVIVIGDSIQRSVYKDLVCMWTQEDSRYLFQDELRAKGELAFLGDKLLSGGKLEGKLVNGTEYREVREYKEDNTIFKYYFVTRCYSEHMASVLNELKTCEPDVIIMNSAFWDIHHYGDRDLKQYKENLNNLLMAITEKFSTRSLFIWNAALPLAARCKGGFLRKGFLTIPLEKIKTANKLACLAAGEHEKVYLDLFSELANSGSFKQAEDGIHWGMRAHRKISNLILTKVCRAWGKKIPDPPPLPDRTDTSGSSPVSWPSYYPDSGDGYEWNGSLASYADGYDWDYWNDVYQGFGSSPTCDSYRIPSPLLYGNSWGSVGWQYHSHYGYSFSNRENEYTPIQSSCPSLFSKRYCVPFRESPFDFSTRWDSYCSDPVWLKQSAYFSEPLPAQAFQFGWQSSVHKSQGLLPTPPGPPLFTPCTNNETSTSYRDRFKKLSRPIIRAKRNRGTKTGKSGNVPLNQEKRVKENVKRETPLHTPAADVSNESSVSTEKLPGERSTEIDTATLCHVNGVAKNSDVNNNEHKGSFHSELACKENIDMLKPGVFSLNDNKLLGEITNDAASITEGVAVNGTTHITKEATIDIEENTHVGMTLNNQSKGGMKRKHEDKESATESKPAKFPREDSSPEDTSCTLFYDNFI